MPVCVAENRGVQTVLSAKHPNLQKLIPTLFGFHRDICFFWPLLKHLQLKRKRRWQRVWTWVCSAFYSSGKFRSPFREVGGEEDGGVWVGWWYPKTVFGLLVKPLASKVVLQSFSLIQCTSVCVCVCACVCVCVCVCVCGGVCCVCLFGTRKS